MNEHGRVASQTRGRGASRLTRVLQLLMALAAVGALYERQWLNAFVIASILGLTAMPGVVGRRIRVFLPPSFELAAVLFVFAALFLGEIRGYYTRFWWWDVVLHTSSGFLLGVLGFVLVFVLNREPHVQLYMAPSFVFLFSFTFALAVGALWEVFEFAVDQTLGMNMQKSGLVDTMWDLIVDAGGALVVSLVGWLYMRRGRRSFLERWAADFLAANPHLLEERPEQAS